MNYSNRKYHNIQVEQKGHALWITLDNPSMKNALTVAMMQDILEVILAAGADPDVRCLVMTGNGDCFSAGGDIKKMAEGGEASNHPLNRPLWNVPGLSAADRLKRREVTGLRIMEALWALEKPSLAVINGHAVAAGLDLALACDLRLCVDTARLGSSYTGIGLIPFDGSMYWLPRMVGLGKALEMMYFGDLIDAAEAHRIGLVNWVVPAEELAERAETLASRLANGPTVAYQLIKHFTMKSLELDFPAALDAAYEAKDLIYMTEDHKQAVQAFLSRQRPTFQGR